MGVKYVLKVDNLLTPCLTTPTSMQVNEAENRKHAATEELVRKGYVQQYDNSKAILTIPKQFKCILTDNLKESNMTLDARGYWQHH